MTISPRVIARLLTAVRLLLADFRAGRALVRDQIRGLGFGVPVDSHLCVDCETYTTTITKEQAASFVDDGIVPCPCGGILRPVWDLPASVGGTR